MQSKKESEIEYEGISVLKQLTENLPSLGDIVKDVSTGFIEMRMERGVGFGWKLYDRETVTVSRWFSSAGSVFPKHVHAEKEWIVCYQGELKLIYDTHSSIECNGCKLSSDNKVATLTPGQCTCHEPNVAHSVEFTQDTWYLSITVPASKYFPQ